MHAQRRPIEAACADHHLLQANRSEAREMEQWLPAGSQITPAHALSLAQSIGVRPVDIARLAGGPDQLPRLAAQLQAAQQGGDAEQIKQAQSAYDNGIARLVMTSRAIDSTTLAGQGGALDSVRGQVPGSGRTPEARSPSQIGAPMPATTAVGRSGSQPTPPPERAATLLRIARSLQLDPNFIKSYPDARVSIVDNAMVKVEFTSRGDPRTMLIGSFRDMERLEPQTARQAGTFLTQRSSLYQGRTAEFAGTSFRMADLTAVVRTDAGDVIGTGTLTYQTAVYGQPRQVTAPDGTVQTEVDNVQQRQILFLAQVAGEQSGGRQAVDPLLAIGRQTRTNIVATTFPLNFQGTADKPALYGPAPGTNPDFAMLWRVRGEYPRDTLYHFGPGQPVMTGADGGSIFNALPSREPDPSNPDDVRTHDRIFYGWINDGDKNNPASIPLYVHSNNRLAGEIPSRDASQGTRNYWIPIPQPSSGRPATLLPPQSNLPQVQSAADLTPRLPPQQGTPVAPQFIVPVDLAQTPTGNAVPALTTDGDPLVAPGTLSPTVEALQQDGQTLAAESSARTGSFFFS